ncbi:DUF5074 domain-containing protein [Gabonibacter massiliensis]|uniref:DUF5074 domain-containing protein n=1 Tax=Gabonibacter massiliensis TaxID=1720195 RepID=UPI0008A92675|nr:DUF5074 domain-containing protein [Gabonibacter massiliensis]
MKKLSLWFGKLCLFTGIVMSLLVACEKDDVSSAPKIENMGISGDTIVAQGENFVITPAVKETEVISYEWKINGKRVSEEKSYTFDATMLGTYTVEFAVSNKVGRDRISFAVDVRKYAGGFYVVNEGKYPDPGSVNYYKKKTWSQTVFETNNTGKNLGKTTTNGVVFEGKMYLVSKQECFLSRVNIMDFKEEARIEDDENEPIGMNGQAYNFCIVDKTTGVLTTNHGALKVNLTSLSLGERLEGMDKNYLNDDTYCGDILKAGEYVFLINNGKIKVYRASDLAFVKELGAGKSGFVQTKDGSLWATNENELVKIDVRSLKVERTVLGDDISVYYDRSSSYRPATFAVSTDGETLFFAKEKKEGWSIYGKEIWKFDVVSRKAAKFYSAPSADLSVYGSALKVNPRTGDLYITYTEDGYSTHYLNTAIYVVDGKSGQEKEKIFYTKENEDTYWFPSVIVFD